MRIAIWTGAMQYWSRVHPANLWEPDAPQMGGSEATALMIAWQLAKDGHDVLLAAKVDYPESLWGDKLRIVPLDVAQTLFFNERYEALVSWDDISFLRLAFDHIPVKMMAFQLNHCQIPYTIDYVIDWYLHPSQWHADRYVQEFGIPPEKQLVGLTNGVAAEFVDADPLPRRQPHVLWCSSPDRGLHHLLGMWSAIKEQVPEAELHIYYDMDRWLQLISTAMQQGITFPTTDRAILVKNYLSLMLDPKSNSGVIYHGGVSRVQCYAGMLAGSVLAYTCDPVAPTECFSMVMLEAMVAGLQVIASDADAFPELWGGMPGVTLLPLPVTPDVWVDQVVKALQKGSAPALRPAPEKYTYPVIARGWVNAIEKAMERVDE